jgi:hypothetical protein
MPVTQQTIEEMLSVSYVTAVVASAGFAYGIVQHDHGVDLHVRRIDRYKGGLIDMGVALDCQLKATVNWTDRDQAIAYDMDVAAYNKLIYRQRKSSAPCILVLFCLPTERASWLAVDEAQLQLRRCCYWTCLSGDESSNAAKKRITIQKTQLLSPDALTRIVDAALKGVLQ